MITTETDSNKTYEYYGVIEAPSETKDAYGNNVIEDTVFFKIGNLVYTTYVDPSDGYRSYLGPIERTTMHANDFPKNPKALVRIVESEGIISIIDVNANKVLIEMGTDDSDDYYPAGWIHISEDEELLEATLTPSGLSPELISPELFI